MNPVLDIGLRLPRARRVQGLSQRALGELLGVRQQQIARWEATGYRTASLERVAAAAQALGVGLEEAPSVLAADASAAYAAAATAPGAASPVRDLGEIAARVRTHAAELRGEWGVARVGVFGSFATGDQSPRSDVNLLVEFSESGKPTGFRFVELPRAIESFLGRKVDVVQPHLLRARLRDRVMREAVYVWQA